MIASSPVSRLINLMYLSLRETELLAVIKEQLAAVQDLQGIIGDSFNCLADCFIAIEQPQAMVSLEVILARITQVVEKLPKSASQLIAEHSVLFFMEQILKELENMRNLIAKVNSKNGYSVV